MKTVTFRLWIDNDHWPLKMIKAIFFHCYGSPTHCQVAILRRIKEDGNTLDGETLYMEAHRRSLLLQMSFIYLPLAIISFFGHYAFRFATGKEIGIDAGCIIFLLLFFRLTFWQYYLCATRSLTLAKKKLMESVKILNRHSREASLAAVMPAVPDLLAQSADHPAKNQVDGEGVQGEGATARKGSIAILLLQELVKKECKRPSIYDGDLSVAADYLIYIANCKKKNFIHKSKVYRKRELIPIQSENARSTHVKYLSLISDHFLAINDSELFNKAEDLKLYVLTR